MKCKDCHACYKGFFESKPKEYVCIGVPEPFVIKDIDSECTEYLKKNDETENEVNTKKENIIKRIEENFSDMEDALISNCAFQAVQLFRDYTNEIIKIIKEEIEK
jgi:hypothetical protein